MKKTFKIFSPKGLYKLCIAGYLFFGLVPTLISLASDDYSFAFTILCAVSFSPFLVGALWAYRFRVIVREDTITVRQGVGKEYSFNVNEITKVLRKISIYRNSETLNKTTIYTKSKCVSVGTLMIGYEEMELYIDENVDPRKIVIKEYRSTR